MDISIRPDDRIERADSRRILGNTELLATITTRYLDYTTRGQLRG